MSMQRRGFLATPPRETFYMRWLWLLLALTLMITPAPSRLHADDEEGDKEEEEYKPAEEQEEKEYKPLDREEEEKKEKERKEWQFIHESKLKPGKEQVKILVGWEKGRIRQFKFEIKQRAVEIREVEVHYGKGAKDLYVINEVFEAGVSTGLFPVDKDNKSYLRKVYLRFSVPELENAKTDEEVKTPSIARLVGRKKRK